MRNTFSIIMVLFLFGCNDRNEIIPNNCPNCSFSTKLDGINWSAIIVYSKIKTLNNYLDTTFSISTREINPQHDVFTDELYFDKIPYDTGLFRIDTFTIKNNMVNSEFWVYEYEKDYITQKYFVIPDGESYIHVKHLDKISRKFEISFNLKMSIYGGENGILYNSTYPKFITFSDGEAKGLILIE